MNWCKFLLVKNFEQDLEFSSFSSFEPFPNDIISQSRDRLLTNNNRNETESESELKSRKSLCILKEEDLWSRALDLGNFDGLFHCKCWLLDGCISNFIFFFFFWRFFNVISDYLYDRGYTITSTTQIGEEMDVSIQAIECPCLRNWFLIATRSISWWFIKF